MIVVCGEALVDLVPTPDGMAYRARPGGSPANVAVGLGRLGGKVALLARLSTDHFGQSIQDHLERSRVDLSLAVRTPARSTVAMVTLNAAGDAGYTFGIEGGADDGWRPEELPTSLPPGAALFVSGALALAVPEMGTTITALLDRERGQRLVALDPNPRPALSLDRAALTSTVDKWLTAVNLVKVSEEDLSWTCPGERFTDVARRWRAAGPTLVVVTRGGDGVYALGPAGEVALPAPAVDLVDTVGAGDAFTAGLLSALDRSGSLTGPRLRELDRDELTTALAFAQRVAALTCTRVGADPPWQSELDG